MYNLPTIATVNTNKKQQTAAHWTYMTRLRRGALHLPSVYVLARTLSLGRASQGAATPGTPWPRRRLRASSLASPTHCSRRWTPPTHSDRQRSTDSSDQHESKVAPPTHTYRRYLLLFLFLCESKVDPSTHTYCSCSCGSFIVFHSSTLQKLPPLTNSPMVTRQSPTACAFTGPLATFIGVNMARLAFW